MVRICTSSEGLKACQEEQEQLEGSVVSGHPATEKEEAKLTFNLVTCLHLIMVKKF